MLLHQRFKFTDSERPDVGLARQHEPQHFLRLVPGKTLLGKEAIRIKPGFSHFRERQKIVDEVRPTVEGGSEALHISDRIHLGMRVRRHEKRRRKAIGIRKPLGIHGCKRVSPRIPRLNVLPRTHQGIIHAMRPHGVPQVRQLEILELKTNVRKGR